MLYETRLPQGYQERFSRQVTAGLSEGLMHNAKGLHKSKHNPIINRRHIPTSDNIEDSLS
jgi:hypothetical protein